MFITGGTSGTGCCSNASDAAPASRSQQEICPGSSALLFTWGASSVTISFQACFQPSLTPEGGINQAPRLRGIHGLLAC